MARHEILRTTFSVVDAAPITAIRSAEPIHTYVRAKPGRGLRGHGSNSSRERSQAIDLTDGPLIRFALLELTRTSMALAGLSPHFVGRMVLQRFPCELMVFYEAKLRKETPPSSDSMRLQFADYAGWQRRTFRKDGAIYKEVLAVEEAAKQRRSAELSFKRPKPAEGISPTSGVISRVIDSALARRLRALAQQQRISALSHGFPLSSP